MKGGNGNNMTILPKNHVTWRSLQRNLTQSDTCFFLFPSPTAAGRSPFQKVARPLPTFKNRWEKKINRKNLEQIKTVADKNRDSGATTGLLSSSWLPGWSPSVWPSGSGHFPAKNVKRAVRMHSKSLKAVHRYIHVPIEFISQVQLLSNNKQPSNCLSSQKWLPLYVEFWGKIWVFCPFFEFFHRFLLNKSCPYLKFLEKNGFEFLHGGQKLRVFFAAEFLQKCWKNKPDL